MTSYLLGIVRGRGLLTLYPLSSLGLWEAVIITPAAAPRVFTPYGWEHKQTASFSAHFLLQQEVEVVGGATAISSPRTAWALAWRRDGRGLLC